jgi:hypothetical protein
MQSFSGIYSVNADQAHRHGLIKINNENIKYLSVSSKPPQNPKLVISQHSN